jgi:hypothetical protein
MEETMPRNSLILTVVLAAIAACDGTTTAPPDVTPADGTAVMAAVGSSAGLVRTIWPSGDDVGPPFYARIGDEPPHVIMVDGWAVIPFYRDPGCMPESFNLLELFDLSGAFVPCALTVEGFNLWRGAPFAGAPMVAHTQGTGAVPFWFVPAEAVLDAMQDGELTITELAALSGRIVGHATHFNEVLHPSAVPQVGGGGHPVTKIVIQAHGTLEDGRRFQFHFTAVERDIRSIRLRFW